MPATLRVDRRDRVIVFSADRPQVRDALDPATLEPSPTGLTGASADPGAGAAVPTGAGSACFSAGMDLRSVRAGGPEAAAAVRRFHEAKRSPDRLPVIAAVRDMAVGGTFELMLMCDLAVAVRDCRFALPEARRGLVPRSGALLPPARG
jgi:enoyl-CoA hydratase